jgi:hypothetical protein
MRRDTWIKGFVGRIEESARVARHPKGMQVKSLLHTVEPGWPGGRVHYRVVSGESGKQYWVKVDRERHVAECSCDWGKFRKRDPELGKVCACSHVLAVWRHINRSEFSRNISAWASREDVERQHRNAFPVGDGIILTTRPAAIAVM